MRLVATLSGRLCFSGEVPPRSRLQSCEELVRSIRSFAPCRNPLLAGYVGTYKGPRENNEDSAAIAIKRIDKGVYALVVVADGVGGLKKGEYASSNAVCQVLLDFYQGYRFDEGWIKGVFDEVNEYVKRRADGGATTLTMAVVNASSGSIAVGNVGDSPMYAVTADGQIYDLTPNKDEYNDYILQAVGHPSYQGPHINIYNFAAGALIGVTDGVSDYLSDYTTLRNILVMNLKQAVETLLASIKKTTRDNATVAALRLYKSFSQRDDKIDTGTLRINSGNLI